jgi:hypothetical protein
MEPVSMIRTFGRSLKNENLDVYFTETMTAAWVIKASMRVLTTTVIRRSEKGLEYTEPMVNFAAKWSPFK